MNRHLLAVAIAVGSVLGVVGCTANADVVPTAPASGCLRDPNVAGCDSPSTGFSCDTADSPEQTDSSLVCSLGTPSNGLVLYCCIQFTSSSCSADPSVQGCSGDSFGFSCTGTDSPEDADASLSCSSATPSDGNLLYCCH